MAIEDFLTPQAVEALTAPERDVKEWVGRAEDGTLTEIAFYTREGEYGFLSNFWRARQEVDGVVYPTNEHYYQTQKTLDPKARIWVRSAPHAFLAMRSGRIIEKERTEFMRAGWSDVSPATGLPLKVEVMLDGLKAKFEQNADLKEKLLATGNARIHEASPTDSYWGSAKKKDGSMGDSWLGKLLNHVRHELRGEHGPGIAGCFCATF